MSGPNDSVPLLIERPVYRDERGFFLEAYNQAEIEATVGHSVSFVQDNHSRSKRGVLRGLHYQLPPKAQGKLVWVARGAVFDVAVDIRRSSPSFGKWVGYELSEDNLHQLWIPPGYAHGFYVLSDVADVLYKTTAYYAPELDRGIRWDDPDIGIAWPLAGDTPILSPKDAAAPSLNAAELFE